MYGFEMIWIETLKITDMSHGHREKLVLQTPSRSTEDPNPLPAGCLPVGLAACFMQLQIGKCIIAPWRKRQRCLYCLEKFLEDLLGLSNTIHTKCAQPKHSHVASLFFWAPKPADSKVLEEIAVDGPMALPGRVPHGRPRRDPWIRFGAAYGQGQERVKRFGVLKDVVGQQNAKRRLSDTTSVVFLFDLFGMLRDIQRDPKDIHMRRMFFSTSTACHASSRSRLGHCEAAPLEDWPVDIHPTDGEHTRWFWDCLEERSSKTCKEDASETKRAAAIDGWCEVWEMGGWLWISVCTGCCMVASKRAVDSSLADGFLRLYCFVQQLLVFIASYDKLW